LVNAQVPHGWRPHQPIGLHWRLPKAWLLLIVHVQRSETLFKIGWWNVAGHLIVRMFLTFEVNMIQPMKVLGSLTKSCNVA
jgi:hypothetical protein